MTIQGVSPNELHSRIAAIQYDQSFGPFHTTQAAPLQMSYHFGNQRPDDLLDWGWTNVSGYTYLTNAQRQMVRDGLAEYARYINVEFVESSDQNTYHLSFVRASDGVPDGQGWWQYTYGGGFQYDGAVVFDTALNFNQSWIPWLILHEIGHAMSFKHTGDYDVLGGGAPAPFLPEDEDNFQFSVMSYNTNPDTSAYPLNLMLYDIAALQERWGANMSTHAGDDTHAPRADGNVSVIWDAGGVDEITAENSTGNAIIDLRPGRFSEFSIAGDAAFARLAVPYGAEIENASGRAGHDVLRGNTLDNRLAGQRGNDSLIGFEGSDTLLGGDGYDTLNGGAGHDVLHGGDSAADLRDILYGGDGDDLMTGGYGNDSLRGDAGADTLTGGFGSDTLIGGTGEDQLTGSALSDVLFGGDGADFINGGFGHDRVNGGAGADRFFHLGIFDHGSDWIQDYNASAGDALQFGDNAARAAQFQVNFVETTGAGVEGVEEAFVIYRPTGQIIWALVDGAAQDSIHLMVNGQNALADLLA
ncbi:M10 family metallopeptidase C-terminal domain-containing protein [Shimia sp. SDUM112013]|uniref:M10 family metallopeptidase C-terminal domain-containing protein n=1 Tax=Shimia sp. SDUM112013 TaxID=3136160 RepID=UPI0032EEE2D5